MTNLFLNSLTCGPSSGTFVDKLYQCSSGCWIWETFVDKTWDSGTAHRPDKHSSTKLNSVRTPIRLRTLVDKVIMLALRARYIPE